MIRRLSFRRTERMVVAAEIDPELLEACRRGDRDAFRELFETYKDKVYSVALRFSGNHATAMDITQDVFVKLFSKIVEFRGDSSFDSWLYRVVVNRCFDHRRKTLPLVPLVEGAIRGLRTRENAADDLVRAETRRAIHAAIAKLSPDLRMAVVLRYTQGLSYEEIAEAFGCSKGTVASRLNRAHAQLARRLSHLGGLEWFDV